MGLCGSSEHRADGQGQHDTASIIDSLRKHTSLASILSESELNNLAQYMNPLHFLPGVSIAAEGDIGRDWFLVLDGALSLFVEEELFACKNVGDTLAMSKVYPHQNTHMLTTTTTTNFHGEQHVQKQLQSASISMQANPVGSGGSVADELMGPASTRTSSSSILIDKPGFGRVMAVSTKPTTLIQLSRSKWVEFQRKHSGEGLTEKLFPLLIEPSESLTKLHFFKGIPSSLLQNLGLMFKPLFFKRGEILFHELSEGHSLFIVGSGTCKAFALVDGQEKILKEFKSQDILGEISLIMNIPRTATIQITSETCTFFELHRDNFKSFFKLLPSAGNIHSIMKTRVSEHFRKYRIPFFASIPDDKYIILAELCKIEQIPAGHVVFREGDPADTFYLVVHGELKVTVSAKAAQNGMNGTSSTSNEHGVELQPTLLKGASLGNASSTPVPSSSDVDPITGERELTRMGPGKYFGEIGLVQDIPRTATVTALTRSVVLSITRDNFQKFFEAAPAAIADFEVKLARYDVRLRSVLYHPLGLHYFTQHLRKEHSEENVLFWKECRDFRHLTTADIPQKQIELQKIEEEMEQEIMEDMKQIQMNNNGIDPAKARRASVLKIQGQDMGAIFDLFVDASLSNPPSARTSNANGSFPSPSFPSSPHSSSTGYMSLNSLIELLKFFQIPLPPDSSVLHEMANQLGFDSIKSPFITRSNFIKIFVEISQGIFPEIKKLEQLDMTLQKINEIEREHLKKLDQEWDEGSIDPTTDFINVQPLKIQSINTTTTSSSSSLSSSPSSPTSNLSLSSKLLLKLCKLIQQLRPFKLVQMFNLYDTDCSGFIEYDEFQTVCSILQLESNPEAIKKAFQEMDDDGSNSITCLEFIGFIFVEKIKNESLQELLETRAKFIYESYISDKAPNQVNIRGPAQKRLRDAMISLSNNNASARRSTAGTAKPKPKGATPTPFFAKPVDSNSDITPSQTPSPTPGIGADTSSPAAAPRITQNLFDEAEEEIMKLMSADSFSRFKQSDLFQQFLVAAGAYNFKGPTIVEETKLKIQKGDPKDIAAAAAMAAAAAAAKPKLRSGSQAFQAKPALIDSLVNVPEEEKSAFLARATSQGLIPPSTYHNPQPSSSGNAIPNGRIVEDDEKATYRAESEDEEDDEVPPPPPLPMQVEVVDMEQIGIDVLTGSGLPALSTGEKQHHRASLILNNRNAAASSSKPLLGRQQTKSVFYTVGSAPVTHHTLLDQGRSASSSIASPLNVPVLPSMESNAVLVVAPVGPAANTLAPVEPTTPSHPASHSHRSTARSHPSNNLSHSGNSNPHSPVVPSSPTSPTSAGLTPLVISDPDYSTPVRTKSSTVNGGSVTNDYLVGDKNESLQSPNPPPSFPYAHMEEDKNPLQSPLPLGAGGVQGRRGSSRRASGSGLLLTLNNEALAMSDKNPLQSPLAVRRASGSGMAALNLGVFSSTVPLDPSTLHASIGDHPSVPAVPLAHFNDADLEKNPLQSPGIQQGRRKSIQDDTVI